MRWFQKKNAYLQYPVEKFIVLMRKEGDEMESKSLITKLFYKIPPYLPFPKGGIIPLFGKEGLGEIFRKICLPHFGLISNNQQKGMALVIALVMLLVLTLVGLSALTTH